MKQYNILNLSGGTHTNIDELLTKKVNVVNSRNVYYDEGSLVTRPGYQALSSNTVTDSIIDQFKFVSASGTTHHLVFTAKNIYEYSPSLGTFTSLSPSTDYWSVTESWGVTQFTDGTLGEIVVVTSGEATKKPRYWNGSGTFTELTNASPCKDVLSFADKVVCVNTYEGGAWQKDRVRWSNTADATTWDASDFQDKVEKKGSFKKIQLFENGHFALAFKDDCKYIISATGDSYVFTIDLFNEVGLLGGRKSVCTAEGLGIFYYGQDYHFRLFTGADDVIIDDNIDDFTRGLTPANFEKIYSYYIPRLQQIRVFSAKGASSNNVCLVFDFRYKTAWIWEYTGSVYGSIVEGWNTATRYWDDSDFTGKYFDTDATGYYDDVTLLDEAPILVYGGTDGKLYKADNTALDDGSTISSYVETAEITPSGLGRRNRLYKIGIVARPFANSTAVVSVKRENETGYANAQTFDLTGVTNHTILTEGVVDITGETFQFKMSSENRFRLIGMSFYYSPKRKAF